MSLQRSLNYLVIASLLFVLLGCATNNHNQSTVPSIATRTKKAITQSAKKTTEVFPTATLTMSPPPEPTLPPEDAYTLLVNLLDTNAGCQLPCWWGIVPDQSTFQDISSQLTPLLGIASYSDSSHARFNYPDQAEKLSVLIALEYSLSATSGRVESIGVNTLAQRSMQDRSEDVYDSAIYANLLQQYTLHQILKNYGLPTQVVLDMEIISAEPESPDFFEIWLLYPERGMIVKYTAQASVTNEKIRGCPAKALIAFWLTSPTNSQVFQKTLKSLTDWNGFDPMPEYLKPVDEATSFTPEKFYQTFTKKPDTCLETPLSIWPSP